MSMSKQIQEFKLVYEIKTCLEETEKKTKIVSSVFSLYLELNYLYNASVRVNGWELKNIKIKEVRK